MDKKAALIWLATRKQGPSWVTLWEGSMKLPTSSETITNGNAVSSVWENYSTTSVPGNITFTNAIPSTASTVKFKITYTTGYIVSAEHQETEFNLDTANPTVLTITRSGYNQTSITNVVASRTGITCTGKVAGQRVAAEKSSGESTYNYRYAPAYCTITKIEASY